MYKIKISKPILDGIINVKFIPHSFGIKYRDGCAVHFLLYASSAFSSTVNAFDKSFLFRT
jgi:hypothetical protein